MDIKPELSFEDWCIQNNRANLLKEWNYQKNDKLPREVSWGSHYKAWWILPYDDKNTGKHFDFEWVATIQHRTIRNQDCPYLCGNMVYKGFNDLATTYPEIAKEWHPTKNESLTPYDVVGSSSKKVWWLLPYEKKDSGEIINFEWIATIANRTKHNTGCPYLVGRAVQKGFNDLATTHPELAKEWHPTKNINITPYDITEGSKYNAWWLYHFTDKQTGKSFDFEWQAKVQSRALKNQGCPYLSLNPKTYKGFNDLATTHPELAKEWHPTKNGDLTPEDISAGSDKKVWWSLPYDDPQSGKHFDFEWQAKVHSRALKNQGCPYLIGQAVWKGFNDLATVYPNLIKEWHPKKNELLTPYDITKTCGKKIWWICSTCGKEWIAKPAHRTSMNSGCPYCNRSKSERLIVTILEENSFDYEEEYRFEKDDISRCPFDFYLNNLNLIIEMDGIQHFEFIPYFFKRNDSFEKRKQTDNYKTQYCYDNNIPILRIPYIYRPSQDGDKIKDFVLTFIKTKEIPQEILDFYKQYDFSNYYTLFRNTKIVA